MRMARSGRRTAAMVGVTSLLLVAGLVWTWSRVVVQYRLVLRSNPPVLSLIETPGTSEGSFHSEEVRQFLQTPAGKEALFGLLVDEISRPLHASSVWHKADFLTALVWIDEEESIHPQGSTVIRLNYSIRDISGGSGGSTELGLPSHSYWPRGTEAGRLRAVWKLIPELAGRQFTTADFPNMAFRFHSAQEILTLGDYNDPGPSPWLAYSGGDWRRFPANVEPLLTVDRFFCLVTPDGPDAMENFLRVLQKPCPTMDTCNGVASQRFLAARTLGELGVRSEKVLSALTRVLHEEEAHLNEADEHVRASPAPEHTRIREFHRKVRQAVKEALEILGGVK